MKGCAAMEGWGSLAGRILLALIFILSGYGKIGSFSQTAAYMASKGLPMPELLLVITIVIELLGGLMIAAGVYARIAAFVIFLWLLPTTFVFHAFWDVEPGQMQNQFNHFMKNVSIMGAMLLVSALGAGPLRIGGDACEDRER